MIDVDRRLTESPGDRAIQQCLPAQNAEDQESSSRSVAHRIADEPCVGIDEFIDRVLRQKRETEPGAID